MNGIVWNKCQCTRIGSPDSPLLKEYLLVNIVLRQSFVGFAWGNIDIGLITMSRLPDTLASLYGDSTPVHYGGGCIYRVSDGVAMMWDKDFFQAHYEFLNPLKGMELWRSKWTLNR